MTTENDHRPQRIRIDDDSCGHNYEEIFGRFFDDSVTEVLVEDPYIRSTHQACITYIKWLCLLKAKFHYAIQLANQLDVMEFGLSRAVELARSSLAGLRPARELVCKLPASC